MISPNFNLNQGFGTNPAFGLPGASIATAGCPCAQQGQMAPQMQMQMQMLMMMQQLMQMMTQMMGGGGQFPGTGGGFPGMPGIPGMDGGFPGGGFPGGGFPGAGFPGGAFPGGAFPGGGFPGGGFPGGGFPGGGYPGGGFPGGGYPGGGLPGGGFPGGGSPGGGMPGGPGPSNPASTGTVMRAGKPIGAQIAQRFDQMVAAAARDGVQLRVTSGKRSYQQQVALYNKYGPGRAARPGRSNHESGNAIDFTNTPGAFNWLKRNAARFGFYNKIPNEPWHYSTSGR